ncbi:hypothetical protein TMatcc_007585 [Talaromyces marneffei ATCC 18224]
MIKATAIATLLLAASATAASTPKLTSQDVYESMLEWRNAKLSSNTTVEARGDNTLFELSVVVVVVVVANRNRCKTLQVGSECCPVNGLPQITGILQYDATSMANDLGGVAQVNLPAQSCTLVSCDDTGGGLTACNFNAYPISVAGTQLGAFSDWLSYYCTSEGYTCGVGLDYTMGYNVWTHNGACSI